MIDYLGIERDSSDESGRSTITVEKLCACKVASGKFSAASDKPALYEGIGAIIPPRPHRYASKLACEALQAGLPNLDTLKSFI